MKKIALLLTLITLSVSALERVPNPCWNTKLDVAEKAVCEVCNEFAANLIAEEDFCMEEQMDVDACLSDFDNCVDYSDILTRNDNCQTNLIKACFERE